MKTQLISLTDKCLNHNLLTNSTSNSESRNRMKKILYSAIQSELTDKQKNCIIEYYINGKKVKDIAKDYSLNPSTVSRHISSAERKLKRIASIYS
ncbi:MAG: sigma-70 family RNA polymerase sigma factor [Ruminococcus sp.]|nr:sigma-70 family RNA polymerase sigma factor [Ruminococcus sp.]